jgi:catechol 2,3-dioxygenase-like lactoylglutathione lyase family enzyme
MSPKSVGAAGSPERILSSRCGEELYRRRVRLSLMPQTLGHVTFLVRNYDEAVAFFTKALGFQVIEDTPQGDGKRWILIAPRGPNGTSLVLAEAANPEQTARIGNQTGGRVFLFLHTDDFWSDYRRMKARNVKFLETPRKEPYGTVAVFEDLYGNKWDLLEPKRNGDL